MTDAKISRMHKGDYLFIAPNNIAVPMRVRMAVKCAQANTWCKLLIGVVHTADQKLIGGHACIIESPHSFKVVSINVC